MIRAVIDTNVLISGLLSPVGNEALIVLAIHQGFVRPCLSEAIIAEGEALDPNYIKLWHSALLDLITILGDSDDA